jgi:multidrug efflux system membrane fusion protein
LAANDRVVTTGFANLSDGAKVIVGKDEQTPSADLAPRKKGSRGPQAKDSTTKDGAASDSSGKDGQGKDGERRKRRSQSEGDASGGGAKAQP